MAKKARAKKAKAKAEKVTPTYLAAGKSFTLGLHDVVRALKVIEKNKRLDKFVRAAKKRKAGVSIDADTVNFVKDFMVTHEMHRDPIGRHIVNAQVPGKDPFQCDFGN